MKCSLSENLYFTFFVFFVYAVSNGLNNLIDVCDDLIACAIATGSLTVSVIFIKIDALMKAMKRKKSVTEKKPLRIISILG